MTPSHQEFTDDHTPLGYLITFRSYGTWLHGDQRGSVDRRHRRFGTPMLLPNPLRERYEGNLLRSLPVKLTKARREAIKRGIREACAVLKWRLWAFNVRTNHVHVVVSANCNSRRVRATLKANATRSMRELGCWQSSRSPWAEKGSRRFLWTEEQLIEAIDYVLYGQGEELA